MTDQEKLLILEAINPMFRACGNSYINCWLQDWLEKAKSAGCYSGPVVGIISELDLDEIWRNSVLSAGFVLDEFDDVVEKSKDT